MSPGFSRAEWGENGKLEVTFDEDHEMDGFGLRYHSKSSADDDIVTKEAPQYGGTVELDVLGRLAQMNTRPPSGEYHLVAYKGNPAVTPAV